ncbi:hypothetical protein UFOVP1604_77 [uncultured Caudovirales phage]|uniref:Uncharacterized protein n=1 Tax=uncultured Caudovirales phage TaxID=2100421 RepID=A0A6J5SW46_9CAUD|nr:hypothetical protein UFOVP1604_77 [uncultured Caudovirales phage]
MEKSHSKILSFEEFTQSNSNPEMGIEPTMQDSPEMAELPLGNDNEPAPAEAPETGDTDHALSTNMMADTEPTIEIEPSEKEAGAEDATL